LIQSSFDLNGLNGYLFTSVFK